MSYLFANPEDRFSHKEAHMELEEDLEKEPNSLSLLSGEAILMSTHNIRFYGQIMKIVPKLS